MGADSSARVSAHVLELYGGDPFAHVVQAAEAHRASHGTDCGLYPAGPHVMHLVAGIVRAARARRMLDLGSGFGYSALWLAAAGGPDAHVDGVDRFEEHVSVARTFAAGAGLADRIDVRAGEVAERLEALAGPYDLAHDDAWFAHEPPYLERLLAIVAPGGVVTMPNWFLREDALSPTPGRDWAALVGPDWAEATRRYARRLAGDRRLHVSWCVTPPLAIVIKLT
jgi:caffeoyl-CoA O-methyltransferase